MDEVQLYIEEHYTKVVIILAKRNNDNYLWTKIHLQYLLIIR